MDMNMNMDMDISHNTKKVIRDPQYLRASTAHVDSEEIRARMRELRTSIANRTSMVAPEGLTGGDDDDDGTAGSGANVCEFDLSKNVLDYLPSPVITPTAQKNVSERDIHGAIRTVEDAGDEAQTTMSRRTLLGKSKFLGVQSQRDSDKMHVNVSNSTTIGGGIEGLDMDPPFRSMFGPNEMRLLALVSHNNMKHAMKQFVVANKNILKKFRLTGTNTTMSMLKEVFGNDPEVVYGPACKSGPLGGDAQLVAMAVTSQLGGCIFFIDPMDAHPHSADIECLVRQGNVHNILMMNNPTTAHICLNTLRIALKMGRMEMFPSFFFDLESPSVEAYKMRQNQVLQSAITHRTSLLQGAIGILKAPSRGTQIRDSMERANKLSLQHRRSSQQNQDNNDGGKTIIRGGGKKVGFSGYNNNLEDFLPQDYGAEEVQEEEEQYVEKEEGKKSKKKKKKFLFFKK